MNTRLICYQILTQVFEANEDIETALKDAFQRHPLDARDKRFCVEICYGTVRWKSKLEWIVGQISNRPNADVQNEIMIVLILSVYQLLYMDRTPPRAVVHEGVELIKVIKKFPAKDFVNAVLRKASVQKDFFRKIEARSTEKKEFAQLYGHPDWIVNRWKTRFGLPKTLKLMETNNRHPPIAIRMNQSQLTDSFQSFSHDLIKKHKILTLKRPLGGCYHLKSYSDIHHHETFLAGKIYLQDEASQLVSHVVSPQPGDVVLDCCCSPGGKLTHLFELAKGESEIWGMDVSKNKLARVSENLSRLKINSIQLIEGDARTFQPEAQFDRILVDAPCSGLGILRRKPQIKWRKKLSDLIELANKQFAILENMAKYVKPRGFLIYSICSFEPEESDLLIGRFLAAHENYKTCPIGESLPPVYRKFVGGNNYFYHIPTAKESMDGFFIVKMQRDQ